MTAVALDLDGVLGDTHPLWDAWLEEAARKFAGLAPLDPAALPADRVAAARELDRWAEAGVGDWRTQLGRFAEERAPLFLRPDPSVNALLRRAHAGGARLGVFSDAPEPLVEVGLLALGARRMVEVAAGGEGALERVLDGLGSGALVIHRAAELSALDAQ